MMALNSANFLVLGLPFMKTEPHHFQCKDVVDGSWHSCSKRYICDNALTRDMYYADVSDSQFIDNWQDQANMLCESKQRIGFLGACFFIGVLVASTIIPVGLLSDIYGRRYIFIGSLAMLLGACIGFLLARSLDELYVYMFMMGLTFPGRIIVATNYAQEFLPQSW